ncbi:MAG: hypothetical protein K2P70_07055 [Hyphomonadaceae bacterium]|nr:hypothetical protein [Hyphomonadaceae bacterium]
MLIGLVALVAAAWIASYATGRGVLVSLPRDFMVSEAFGTVFDPTTGATDTPVGYVCTYLRFDGMRTQYLVERSVWHDDQSVVHGLQDARMIENWTADTGCPLLSEGLS